MKQKTSKSQADDIFAQAAAAPWRVAGKLHLRRTRIVATIGPATQSPKMLKAILNAGVNIVRVNFSHGEPEDHVVLMQRIRSVAASSGRTVSILADLCGPKIRVGQFQGGQAMLEEKSRVLITPRNVLGSSKLIPSQYTRIVTDTQPGERILLDDGNLELRVLRKVQNALEAVVIHGGILKDRKGMNLPDSKITVPALTPKDRRDAAFSVKGGADYIALSFVRSAKDVMDLKRLLKKMGVDTPVIAKIEKPEALEVMDSIMEAADGIMVARGDLGVEMLPQKVPIIQDALIERANQLYKPVIVATQMLESMISNPRPTRAEVTDVAMACMADADAVMLSAETAIGKYPVEAVKTMDNILRETESYQFFTQEGLFKDRRGFRRDDALNALGVATAQISRDLKVRGIAVLTRSGLTARVIAADRPAAPVFAFTSSQRAACRMNILWGVYPCQIGENISFREFVHYAEKTLLEQKLAKRGDHIVLLSGINASDNSATNSITLHKIK